jgi:phosphatidylinositol 4-kinase type 2
VEKASIGPNYARDQNWQALTHVDSFPFGWLFLPVDLIGRPFSQKTRDHFLPLLTSTRWWSQTQLALRKVFQIDPDFQERMFARQMAVMKGQAWNVVETLKTHDHGPLELTRRAKVCVWDDLVDVPVAVPMRATSSEMRRRAELDLADAIAEEMDIAGSSRGDSPNRRSAPDNDDLLGLTTPPADLPNPNRFELAPDSPGSQTPPTELQSPALPNGTGSGPATGVAVALEVESPTKKWGHTGRPLMSRSSLSHGPPRSLNMYSPERRREQHHHHQRRFSFTTLAGRRESNSIAAQLYGPGGPVRGESSRHAHDYFFGEDGDEAELDGDLGYAAAQGMEGNRRQVIVERLEPVKSKNPVFTWC